MRRYFLLIVLGLLAPVMVSAQFALTGDDPGSLKWKQIRTPHFQVIFPAKNDSLGRVYAEKLEYWYPRVGTTIGVGPNEYYKKPLPVVLHTHTSVSNGVVTWLPRRIDLFTVPDASSPLPAPWEDHLVAHESRHASQMQIGHYKKYTVFNVLLGDFFPGAMAALYGGPAFFEGDAVVCETELTGSCRGYNGAFLEYYRYSSFTGDTRDYWQWRYGSQRRYTPDYYRAGYLGVAGIRSFSNDSTFSKRFYANIRNTRWPFPFFVLNKTSRKANGMRFKDSFKATLDSLSLQWKADAELRKPYTIDTIITSPLRLHSEYKELCTLAGCLYAVRSGIDRSCEFVRINKDGSASVINAFASSASHLHSDENSGRIYWSETVQSHRWSLSSSSVIRYMDIYGHKHSLTRKGRFFNPAVGPDGTVLAVEYPQKGGSAVVTISPENGKVLRRIVAPDGMQVVECAYLGDRLVASCITKEGASLVLPEEGFRSLMNLGRQTVGDLFSHDGCLYYTADPDGTNELYAYDGNTVKRVTSTLTGATDFVFYEGELYYSALSKGGRMVRKAVQTFPTPALAIDAFPEADKLSGQYKGMAEKTLADVKTAEIPEAKKYSKLGNIFRFHSWAPVYINIDAVSSLSAETVSSLASVGATAFFQNSLSTASGYVGAAFRPSNSWRPELHARFSYSGLYPVIEASVDFNDRRKTSYYPTFSNTLGKSYITGHETTTPSVTGTVKAYIPWVFSSGGWSRGVIPQLSASICNDHFSDGRRSMTLAYATASLRGYCMRPIPKSCIYPRWGIGAEMGYSSYLGMTDLLKPSVVTYAYGYVPGFIRTHGIRLSALWRSGASEMTRFTFDYALPFAAVDWSFLGPVAYIRNFELTARANLYLKGGTSVLGGDLSVHLGNLLWIPYDTRIGVSLMWGPETKKLYPGFVFSISM